MRPSSPWRPNPIRVTAKKCQQLFSGEGGRRAAQPSVRLMMMFDWWISVVPSLVLRHTTQAPWQSQKPAATQYINRNANASCRMPGHYDDYCDYCVRLQHVLGAVGCCAFALRKSQWAHRLLHTMHDASGRRGLGAHSIIYHPGQYWINAARVLLRCLALLISAGGRAVGGRGGGRTRVCAYVCLFFDTGDRQKRVCVCVLFAHTSSTRAPLL